MKAKNLLVIPVLLLAAWGTQLTAQLPATQLRGTYSSKPPTQNVQLVYGSDPFAIEFRSGNMAFYRGPLGANMEVDYEVRGKQVLIKYPSGTVVATIGDDGCLDGGDQTGVYGKLCKMRVTAGAPAAAPTPVASYADRITLASMKTDLRNLVTAEEAYFADSVKYTSHVSNFETRTGNVLGSITVTRDGWNATMTNSNLVAPLHTCAIYIGSTSVAPATKEGEPNCN